MIELNVVPVDPSGQPVRNPIITLYVLDVTWLKEAPLQPKIRNWGNFYSSALPYAPVGFAGPYQVFGEVVAPGFQPAYIPMQQWSGAVTLNINVPMSFSQPFKTAPRFWKANMCGIRVGGLPAVPGGAPGNPDLFLSWFYHLYDTQTRARIRQAYRARGLTHWLTSWPDAQAAGLTPQQFADLNRELVRDDFFPCPMLSAKPTSSADVRSIEDTLANILLVLPALVDAKVPMFCQGWELSLWETPEACQWLTNQLAPIIVPTGAYLYVHFQEGYPSFQSAGHDVASYWSANVGLLTGLLYQKKLSQNDAQFLDSISDCLQRFCGGFHMPSHSGTHDGPFDFVALELDAQWQYNDNQPEAEGDRLGQLAIHAPHCFGPDGTEAFVMGAGNGI